METDHIVKKQIECIKVQRGGWEECLIYGDFFFIKVSSPPPLPTYHEE
jgi:hypothetical protein